MQNPNGFVHIFSFVIYLPHSAFFSLARASSRRYNIPVKKKGGNRMLLEDYLAQNDICVVSREMPGSVRAFVVRHGQGYCVVLNAIFPDELQRRALRHELKHLARGDDASLLPVSEIERLVRA